MKRYALWVMMLLVSVGGALVSLSAQPERSVFDEIKRAHQMLQRMPHLHPRAAGWTVDQPSLVVPQPINISHYKIQLRLRPPTPLISGAVTIEGETVETIHSIHIDALSNLTIERVTFNGMPQSFERTSDKIRLNFSSSLPAAFEFTIVVSYSGRAVTGGVLGGGMLVARHNNFPVIGTLSQPYSAPSWWPCIDNPADKTTAEIEVNVPEGYVVASNGLLEATQRQADRTVTYTWRERYPIANYLIAVTTTNFVTFEDSYTALDGTTMPLVYYVYPEHLTQAQRKFPVTRRAMELFAPLFGEYPFLQEKYGMVEFPWSGAMEHQTLTSLGDIIVNFSDFVVQDFISHELAHQWWGNWVTMKTWNDIWLNEGFATYSEVLFFERFLPVHPGELMARSYGGALVGTVYAENAANPWDDPAAIYTKGAWVLHMLRRVLGEERFFAALKDYGRRFAFGNASTADFQHVCEAHYGASLQWFFEQWVYTPARPIYRASYVVSPSSAQGRYTVTLNIEQQQTHPIAGRVGEAAMVYIMPIDVTLYYADGSSETRTVWNDARRQSFTLTATQPVTRIGIDEQNWILKELIQN
ncbi:MAG: M1 family aminopeptidase [Acidobacteriota bacterium]|nr:M1 family aminopeptidase [Blastocatellia bacterium]MDW8239495.1 M1 family aminopeptidase [Acidobacteriota bacterium]